MTLSEIVLNYINQPLPKGGNIHTTLDGDTGLIAITDKHNCVVEVATGSFDHNGVTPITKRLRKMVKQKLSVDWNDYPEDTTHLLTTGLDWCGSDDMVGHIAVGYEGDTIVGHMMGEQGWVLLAEKPAMVDLSSPREKSFERIVVDFETGDSPQLQFITCEQARDEYFDSSLFFQHGEFYSCSTGERITCEQAREMTNEAPTQNQWEEFHVDDDTKISPYHRKVTQRVIDNDLHMDMYDVLAMWKTDSPAIDHAVKKLLNPGNRGDNNKNRLKDLKEALWSIEEAIKLEDGHNA